jgi:hypothetical protein
VKSSNSPPPRPATTPIAAGRVKGRGVGGKLSKMTKSQLLDLVGNGADDRARAAPGVDGGPGLDALT